MSSVVTAVPPVFTEWCIAPAWFPSWNRTAAGRSHCGNSSRGLSEEDFETICCPGTITNIKFPIFKDAFNGDNYKININDLVCCPGDAALADATTCSSSGPGADPTPLISYAATPTDKAELFEATYPGASQGAGTSPNGDMILTEVPYCIWMYTGNGTGMSTISVAPPVYTTTITPLGGWEDDGTASPGSSLGSISTPSSGTSSPAKTTGSPLPSTSATLRSSSSASVAATTTPSSASRSGFTWPGAVAAIAAIVLVAASAV
ncbi:hypothetical protein GQ53DRAFT_48716 [Thozetella sp. PMI_491]|nr:hypothetical protein GQ53DRAFT_48716 [Thozetella sp. PMI_491]